MRSYVFALLLLPAPALAFAFGGCGSSPGLLLCGEIPVGGCPIGRGGTCADEACAGLFDCVEGAWTLVENCADAGTSEGTGGGVPEGGADAGCDVVPIDKTGETTGCAPDLQSPDCPAAAADTCAETACLTDCSDFFLCTERGWIDVAYCTDEGSLVVLQARVRPPISECALETPGG